MAAGTLIRNTTLPDSSSKEDFHNLVDTATVEVTEIVNTDISLSAAIAPTKLAQITTAGKVSGAALTSLANVPSGAGSLPIANIPYKDEDDMATNSASHVPTQQSVKAYTDGKFNASTGHDHDGSDSKKVIYTNLDMTGITNGHVLYNNNGTPAGTSFGKPVIFQYIGSENREGTYSSIGGSPVGSMTLVYRFLAMKSTTYVTGVSSKWVKDASVSSVAYYIKAWKGQADTEVGLVKINIGTANAEVTMTDDTATWYNGTIDVSSLSNGTAYDITIQGKNDDSNSAVYVQYAILQAN